MIDAIRQKLSRFRSELHMSRYEKALKQGKILITMLKQIDKCGLHIEVQTLITNIEEEIQLAASIEKILTQGNDNTTKHFQKQEVTEIKVENKINSQTQIPSKWGKTREVEKVGKWGKTKTSPQKQMSISQPLNYSAITLNYSIESVSEVDRQKKQQEEKIKQIVLEEDERQILERQVILPLNIPQFFKNKQPHRLIVCYYEKCKDLIKVLQKQIQRKKQIVELEDLSHWTASGKQDFLSIYIAPFSNGQQKLIGQIFQYQNNFLVLYSEINRQLLTQKSSILKKEGFQLKF